MAATVQTLTTAQDILREIYDDMREAVYHQQILFYRLRKRTAKMKGKQLVFPIHVERNWGTGPRPETGTGAQYPVYLPTPGSQGWDQGLLRVAHYYGGFTVTGVALDAAAGEGGLVNLLNTEMTGLKRDMTSDPARDVYGDGTGKIAAITEDGVGGGLTATVDSIAHLIKRRPVVVAVRSTGLDAVENTISSWDSDTKIVTFASALEASADSTYGLFPLGIHTEAGGNTSSAANQALVGLETIVAEGGAYAGIDRTAGTYNGFFDGVVLNTGGDGLQPDTMMEMWHLIQHTNDGKTSLILTSPRHWRELGGLMYPMRGWEGNIVMLDGGYRSLNWNGIPVVPDPHCPDGRMYWLDERNLFIDEQVPFHMNETGGGYLRYIGTGATAEDKYEARAEWRLQLTCPLPNTQGVIIGLAD